MRRNEEGDEREEVAETVEVAGEGVSVSEKEVGEADGLSALCDHKENNDQSPERVTSEDGKELGDAPGGA